MKMGPVWFTVQTKPRQERVADENLRRQDFETYLPDIIVSKRQKGKWVDVIEPLFPRYLFIHANPTEQDMSPIRSTIGVTGLVRFAEEPVPVPDRVIEFLKNTEKSGHHVMEEPTFKKDEKVEIMDGPFKGLPGIFRMSKGEDRAVVLISILGRESQTILKKDDLAKY